MRAVSFLLLVAGCGTPDVDMGSCPQMLACMEDSSGPDRVEEGRYGLQGICWDGDEAMHSACRAHCDAELLVYGLKADPALEVCEPWNLPGREGGWRGELSRVGVDKCSVAVGDVASVQFDMRFGTLPQVSIDIDSFYVPAVGPTGGLALAGGVGTAMVRDDSFETPTMPISSAKGAAEHQIALTASTVDEDTMAVVAKVHLPNGCALSWEGTVDYLGWGAERP